MVEKSNSIARPHADGEIPKPEDILDSMDWEDRLAKARAQRARIQAEQTKHPGALADKQAKIARPILGSEPLQLTPSSFEGATADSLRETGRGTKHEIEKKISGAKVVLEPMEWEDRIAQLRARRQGDQAKRLVHGDRLELVVSKSARQDLPAPSTPEKPVEGSAVQKIDNGIGLRSSGPPTETQSTPPPAISIPRTETIEPSRLSPFAWRLTAGFAIGAAFGLGIASSDLLKNAVQQMMAGIAVAPTASPVVTTTVEQGSIPQAGREAPAVTEAKLASDALAFQRRPGQLAAPASLNSPGIALPAPNLVRPDPWNSPTLGLQAALLAGALPLPTAFTDAWAHPTLVPTLADPELMVMQQNLAEPTDWYRVASTMPVVLVMSAPSGLFAPEVSPSKPFLEMPVPGDGFFLSNTSSVPPLHGDGYASATNVPSPAQLTDTAQVPPIRSVVLTLPTLEPQTTSLSDSAPPPSGNAEIASVPTVVPLLANFAKADSPKYFAEPEDWFRMASSIPIVLGMAAPPGLSELKIGPLNPTLEVPIQTAKVPLSNAPTALALQMDGDQAPTERSFISPGPQEIVVGLVSPEIDLLETGSKNALPDPAAISGILVHILAPSSLSDERLNSTSAMLEQAGYPLKDPARVGFTVSQNNVRYYHAEDASIAQALAEMVGGTARDFTSYSPSPPAGTIEVWMAGAKPARSSVAKAKPARVKKRAKRPDPDLNKLRNRLVNQLRRGDHL